jgi:Glycosyltransferase WbsX
VTGAQQHAPKREPESLTVACYTCPLWHRSALFDQQYAPGWTEYVLMQGARPWFAGHHQPRQPLLGALDERLPATWERYNGLAAAHGIDVFIWDWYWYANEPAMHEALEEGFLRAPNCTDVRFAIMWTNHPWLTLFPTVHGDGTRSFPHARDAPDRLEDVWRSLSYVVARYLHLPNYWRIDGKPVLVIWDAGRLRGLFGLEQTRRLLDELRSLATKLGHDGIHLHHDCTLAIALGSGDASTALGDIAGLGFDSYGLYNPIVLAGLRRPVEEELPKYGVVAADVVREVWPELDAVSPLPFFPAVSPGWDNAPRHNELPRRRSGNRNEWPAALIVVDETPAAFEALVRQALAFLDARPGSPRILTVGCWNEWTEGQYILPDTRLGYGMLEALARGVGRPTEKLTYASPAGDPWPGETGPGPRLTADDSDRG